MAHCTPTGCSGECNQGRDCEISFMATRRVLGLSAEQVQLFESRTGGALIEDGHAVYDEPPITTESACEWAVGVLVGVLVAVCLAAVLSPFVS